MDEDAIIAEIFAPLASDHGADGLGDDAAAFSGGSGDVVVSCDGLAAGVHFFPDDPAEAIAAKALRVNLSDVAAKGAEPFGYLVALALGRGWSPDWVRGFAAGLAKDQARYGVHLLGGDTLRASEGGGTTIVVTAMGRLPGGAIVRRRGAKAGDAIVLTGTIGDAALGLRCRSDKTFAATLAPVHVDALLAAYLYPDPPVVAAAAVRTFASGAMDVSDGLVGDLEKMARVAGLSAILDIDAVPFSDAARAAIAAVPEARDLALTGGDDYQILATMAPDNVPSYQAALAGQGVCATPIGTMKAGDGSVLTMSGGRAVKVQTGRFSHF
ncbi:MAG: thiamine-phosphate kinase [Devosia sp.]